MYMALNRDGTRIVAHKDLPREEKSRCPVCGGDVRLRIGNSNAPHFAHVDLQQCSDDFSQDMSEWHRAWQELFPAGNREIVIEHNGEKHRADVRCYGTVIEFQHSPISEGEFHRRNSFYTSAGYNLIWIFDALDIFSSGRLSCTGECWKRFGDYGENFIWKYPWRFLSEFMPQEENKVAIYFHTTPFGSNPRTDEDGYIEKVVWVNPEYKPSWGRLRTSYRICNFAELLQFLASKYKSNYTSGNAGVRK